MSTTPCSQCGTANRPGAKFCSQCGQTVTVQPQSTRLQTGQIVNRQYTIMRHFSRGGMGSLYLATQPIAGQQRKVVIKEMLDYFDATNPQARQKADQRFEAEAATLAALNINGIPQIFDFFQERGHNYIVMQFIEGKNLQESLTTEDDTGQIINGAPYPPDLVWQWAIQAARILENLIQQNVVHLDIKPANLIIDNSGNLWLVDFGTSQVNGAVQQPGGQAGRQKSSVYGTMGYAPYEQISGHAEPRSDVYALAATLYHLLTDDDPRNQPFDFPRLDTLPETWRNALTPALNQHVDQRLTARQLRDRLQTKDNDTPAFVWRDGTTCNTAIDLVEPALRYWDEAKSHFAGGDWGQWFKAIHDNVSLQKQVDARLQYKSLEVALDQPFPVWRNREKRFRPEKERGI